MILIVGNLDIKGNNISGQTARSRQVCHLISEALPQEKIIQIDISVFSWNLFLLPIQLLLSDRIYLIGARNFIKLLGNLLSFLFLVNKCYFIPTGGWLVYVYKNPEFNFLKNAPKVYIQSKELCIMLNEFHKCEIFKYLPNFRKDFKRLSIKRNVTNKVIFNSRISRDKGIFDAINAVQMFNDRYGNKIDLDIYGQYRDVETQKELSLRIKNIQNIEYKGVYNESEALSTVHNYDLVLFPSYYDGEGVPGSLLVAIFAGVPIIATRWNFNSEIVENNYNGFLVPIKDPNSILDKMIMYYSDYELFYQHSKNALTKSEEFTYKDTLIKFK